MGHGHGHGTASGGGQHPGKLWVAFGIGAVFMATRYHIELAILQVEGGSSAQRCRELSW